MHSHNNCTRRSQKPCSCPVCKRWLFILDVSGKGRDVRLVRIYSSWLQVTLFVIEIVQIFFYSITVFQYTGTMGICSSNTSLNTVLDIVAGRTYNTSTGKGE